MLGEAGFAIITGGGPGIMEAANRGAREARRDLDRPEHRAARTSSRPTAASTSPLTFHYFFARKVMFVRYASAFVVFPGGFGTLDELFESLTLIQTEQDPPLPRGARSGSDYWSGLLDWLRRPARGAGQGGRRGPRPHARHRRPARGAADRLARSSTASRAGRWRSVEDGARAVPGHRLVARRLAAVPERDVEVAGLHAQAGGDLLAGVDARTRGSPAPGGRARGARSLSMWAASAGS